MVPSPPDSKADVETADDDAGAAGAQSREWRYPDAGVRTWSLRDAGKAAVPLVVGALAVWIPYLVLVMWATRALVARVDPLSPLVALALVVFLSLTTASSFLLSAVALVDRLLPWESPLTA